MGLGDYLAEMGRSGIGHDIFEGLDMPRRALWGGAKAIGQGDFLRAAPLLAGGLAGGVAALNPSTRFWAPTIGNALGGVMEAFGESVDPERFTNVGEDAPWYAKMAGDPGVLGNIPAAVGLGRRLMRPVVKASDETIAMLNRAKPKPGLEAMWANDSISPRAGYRDAMIDAFESRVPVDEAALAAEAANAREMGGLSRLAPGVRNVRVSATGSLPDELTAYRIGGGESERLGRASLSDQLRAALGELLEGGEASMGYLPIRGGDSLANRGVLSMAQDVPLARSGMPVIMPRGQAGGLRAGENLVLVKSGGRTVGVRLPGARLNPRSSAMTINEPSGGFPAYDGMTINRPSPISDVVEQTPVARPPMADEAYAAFSGRGSSAFDSEIDDVVKQMEREQLYGDMGSELQGIYGGSSFDDEMERALEEVAARRAPESAFGSASLSTKPTPYFQTTVAPPAGEVIETIGGYGLSNHVPPSNRMPSNLANIPAGMPRSSGSSGRGGMSLADMIGGSRVRGSPASAVVVEGDPRESLKAMLLAMRDEEADALAMSLSGGNDAKAQAIISKMLSIPEVVEARRAAVLGDKIRAKISGRSRVATSPPSDEYAGMTARQRFEAELRKAVQEGGLKYHSADDEFERIQAIKDAAARRKASKQQPIVDAGEDELARLIQEQQADIASEVPKRRRVGIRKKKERG